MKGIVHSINISKIKGEKKKMVKKAYLKENFGIIGDAHFGNGKRQISLLPFESFKKIKNMKKEIKPGVFAENITTKGLDFGKLKINDLLKIGEKVVLKISEIGKDCHNPCNIFKNAGFCIMPKEGVFAEVLKGGEIKRNDIIYKLERDK